MERYLEIEGVSIHDDSDCYVIAEIGNNHQGSLDKCKEMFRVAKDCGADAVKLQKRDNRTLYTQAAFNKPYDHENSFGNTYGEHREFLEFGKAEYLELKAYATSLGITFFATAFDLPSADFLAEIDLPMYKIASGDLKNIPLLQYIASFKKPIILSTGGGTIEDVERAYEAIMPINPQLCILQCTASYPANFEELDLKVIQTYREMFPEINVGLSSHDNGIAMAVAAYVLGARVIEKHFTLNRALKGTDHAFSLEPTGLRKMVRDLKRTRQALGDGQKKIHMSERPAVVKMGKKLVAASDLPAGHVLTAADIAIKSPGDGIPPYELEQVIGQVLTAPVQVDEAIAWSTLANHRQVATL
ncbi:N-acetylneuraminate synthase family protein [Gloeocapsa sp. PCC 73106]|uniref:N-acetylneuraminate synthase family protein n=1 Tax=Gloeocapsa sp. PCC 73106 TaxID=102232 RepID=UPI0002ABB6B3|nr:N-acetylneuraminate synthase family protein [Gloeocapsa sp. PCC 73106]ELR99493.1 sialic acid synthase [Gloeocapsa sp. PCC 73106]